MVQARGEAAADTRILHLHALKCWNAKESTSHYKSTSWLCTVVCLCLDWAFSSNRQGDYSGDALMFCCATEAWFCCRSLKDHLLSLMFSIPSELKRLVRNRSFLAKLGIHQPVRNWAKMLLHMHGRLWRWRSMERSKLVCLNLCGSLHELFCIGGLGKAWKSSVNTGTVDSLQSLQHLQHESWGQRSKSRRTKNRDAEQHKRNASACPPCVRRQSSFATPRTRMRSDLLDFSHLPHLFILVYAKFQHLFLKTFANHALLRPGYTPNCREHVLVATRNTLGASKKLNNQMYHKPGPSIHVGQFQSSWRSLSFLYVWMIDQVFTSTASTIRTEERVIKLVERQVDPFQPPKFKHKKALANERHGKIPRVFSQIRSVFQFAEILSSLRFTCQTCQISQVPRGPPSPPPPVHHSPPRKLTAKEMTSTESTDQRPDMTNQLLLTESTVVLFLLFFESLVATFKIGSSFHSINLYCGFLISYILPGPKGLEDSTMHLQLEECKGRVKEQWVHMDFILMWHMMWNEVYCLPCPLCLSSHRQLRQCSLSPGIHDPAGQALVSRWSKFAGAHLALNGI